ncbi:hypothetical protein PCANC_05513 [Puccinia coronata f. sp. avenae]|uniref:Uncharacterized protein n=1 Tax=Puccinia coronata f. sp. avenae TaxID=200324 RepID=A0A2N5T6J5_9BASI|nr:hypothetical protein PCANC_05513 [Puccinia coronata f. sp. avenae]
MAKLTELPAELVNRIIQHVLYLAQPPSRRPPPNPADRHHLLDHTQINCAAKPKPRPHLERTANSRSTARAGDNSPYRPPTSFQVSWLEGLPKNPLVPLALVSRTFCECVQEYLFKNVALCSTWTASLFLESLTSIPPYEDRSFYTRRLIDHEGKQHSVPPPLSPLAQHVRSLQFAWGGPCSMGKGGVSMLCEIIESCPLLENIAICNMFQLACKEPLLKALASRPHIREFVLLKNSDGERANFQWRAHEVARLFMHWNSMETVDFRELAGRPTNLLNPEASRSMPTLSNCAIRTMILTNHNLDELELSNLLKSCRHSMRTLKIANLSYNHHGNDRRALCRVLQEYASPNLECLMLQSANSGESSSDLTNDDHLTSPGLLDILFNHPTAMKNLKTLAFIGTLATGRLFERLPKSLVKLAWEHCDLPPSALLEALSSAGGAENSLPNLKCCSVRSRYGWKPEEELAVKTTLDRQGACFHSILDPGYGSPTWSDAVSEERRADEENMREIEPWDRAEMMEDSEEELTGWE